MKDLLETPAASAGRESGNIPPDQRHPSRPLAARSSSPGGGCEPSASIGATTLRAAATLPRKLGARLSRVSDAGESLSKHGTRTNYRGNTDRGLGERSAAHDRTRAPETWPGMPPGWRDQTAPRRAARRNNGARFRGRASQSRVQRRHLQRRRATEARVILVGSSGRTCYMVSAAPAVFQSSIGSHQACLPPARDCAPSRRTQLQAKKGSSVGGRHSRKQVGLDFTHRGDTRGSERDPRGLVPAPPVRYRREVGCIGFHQQSVVRHHPYHVVTIPVSERHNPAERDVPAGVDGDLRECGRSSEAVQHAD